MLAPSGGGLILYQAYGNLYAMTGRKAHLLEDKQIPSVGVFDEVFSTWMTFGGNTRDLGSFGEETDEITDLHQILEEVMLTERGDGVTSIKRRIRDLFSDDALYGRLPLSLIPYPQGSSKFASMDELEHDELMRRLKQNLLEAKNIMEVKANRNRHEVEFKVGNKIVERVGKVAYRLALPSTSRIHLVFHVLILKLFSGNGDLAITELPEELQVGQPLEKPVAICDSPMVLQNGSLAQQVLVQWDGRSPKEATWEWTTDFKDTYPLYNLEDKVISKARENVPPRTMGWAVGRRPRRRRVGSMNL
ncbi:ty3-gypsy retrotransposon protein [Tanacetum coccineum]